MPQYLRLRAERSVLVLIDYQERLMPAIENSDDIVRRAAFLGQVASELHIPVIGTAQNPERLGRNRTEVAGTFDDCVDKMTFGAFEGGLDVSLARLDRHVDFLYEVVIAGCETHVCLLQSALALLETGRRVWVVADASGSRHSHDRIAALDRLARAGATIVTAEMVAFEWMRTARHESFRTVSALVKEL